MSDFKAKMHQVRFPLGTRWRSLHRSSTPLTVFEGSNSKQRESRRAREMEEKVKVREGETRWKNFGVAPPMPDPS